MAFRDSWHRALVYFGLAEEHDEPIYEPEPGQEPESELEDRYRDRPNVRRLQSRRRRDDIDDIFADHEPPPTPVLRSVGRPRHREGAGRGRVVPPGAAPRPGGGG